MNNHKFSEKPLLDKILMVLQLVLSVATIVFVILELTETIDNGFSSLTIALTLIVQAYLYRKMSKGLSIFSAIVGGLCLVCWTLITFIL